MINGVVNHKDSSGNTGSSGPGDVQWMTSGGGIMHEEMPQAQDAEMIGFQLWVNLPADLKMCRPRYQNIDSDQIPEVTRKNGVKIRVISGEVDGVGGAVAEIYADPIYFDVTVPKDGSFSHAIQPDFNVFAYVFEGMGLFGPPGEAEEKAVGNPHLVVFSAGDSVHVRTTNQSVRFLLLAGKPLNEPIARYGPFVMNTKEEIKQALADLRNGTFVKS